MFAVWAGGDRKGGQPPPVFDRFYSRALQVGFLAFAVSGAQSAEHDVFTSTGSYLYLMPGMCSL